MLGRLNVLFMVDDRVNSLNSMSIILYCFVVAQGVELAIFRRMPLDCAVCLCVYHRSRV